MRSRCSLWLPLSDRLWIVPGPVACFGRCRGCGEWFSVRDLSDRKPGGGHGTMIGTCPACDNGGEEVESWRSIPR